MLNQVLLRQTCYTQVGICSCQIPEVCLSSLQVSTSTVKKPTLSYKTESFKHRSFPPKNLSSHFFAKMDPFLLWGVTLHRLSYHILCKIVFQAKYLQFYQLFSVLYGLHSNCRHLDKFQVMVVLVKCVSKKFDAPDVLWAVIRPSLLSGTVVSWSQQYESQHPYGIAHNG